MVGPRHVSHEDFFTHFPQILERLSPAGAIEEIIPLPYAYVPVLKMEYCGISIDLVFTRLHLASVSQPLDLKDKSLLRGINDQEARSINGIQVTEEIFNLVPRIKSFRSALRAIKLWAQRRSLPNQTSTRY